MGTTTHRNLKSHLSIWKLARPEKGAYLRSKTNPIFQTLLDATARQLIQNNLEEDCANDVVKGVSSGFSLDQKFTCPGYDRMFVPGSLGAQTDIPPALKQKIAQIQAPSKGAKVLPAKYYHTIAATMSSCFLIRAGIPKFLVNQITMGAINAYRAGRLCQTISGGGDVLLSKPKETWQKMIAELRANPSVCPGSDWNSNQPGQCLVKTVLKSELIFDKDITTEILHRKLDNRIAMSKAKQMFRDSPAYKDSSECSPVQLTTAVREYFEKHGTGGKRNPCEPSESPEECAKIRDIMATWAVDFEWSEAQHQAGVEFAAKNCPPLAANQNPVGKACEAYAKIKPQNAAASFPAASEPPSDKPKAAH